MELVKPNDIIHAVPGLNNPAGERVASLLFKIMKLDKINNTYGKIYELPPDAFIDAVIKELGINFLVSPDECQNIPRDGPFITISNHAYGGIDGIVLLKILPSVRPDFKILMNFLLAKIKPIDRFGFKVNPFENIPQMQSSYGGLKEALLHLKNGHPVGLFPAGEVAALQLRTGTVTDKKWPHSILKLIRTAQVSIVPVYFTGHNSILFSLLGMIHPVLRTARLPAEMYNKTGKEFQVRIGRPILVRDLARFKDIGELGKYLRMRTFSLGIQPEKHRRLWQFTFHHAQPVVLPVLSTLITVEIERLKHGNVLFSLNEHFVFCAHPGQIPNIMVELGRLREITYREVGEGTNKPCDLDEFDRYYDQLFIWDDSAKMIIGGYRIGYGKQIIESHGVKGFYINTLFHI